MACPVCFSGEDPVVRESVNAGLGVLLGVTLVVLGCFARFFVMLARRSASYETQLRRDRDVDARHSPDVGHDEGSLPAAVR